MKRLASIILCFALLFVLNGCSSNSTNEDGNKANQSQPKEVVLHGGLNFGMTKEQVIDFEAKKEIELVDNTTIFGVGSLKTKGKIKYAGNYADLYFAFEDEKLVSMIVWSQGFSYAHYSEKDSEFYDNDAVLNEKYGATIATKGNYIKYPTKGYNATDLLNDSDFEYLENNSDVLGRTYGFKIEDSRQRLVRTADGYVDIIHILYSDLFTSGAEPIQSYNSILSYSYMTEEAYNDYVANEIKKNIETNQARENDL